MRYRSMLAIPFVLLAVLVTSCATNSSRIVETLPSGINLTAAKNVEIRAGTGNVVLSGAFSNNAAKLAGSDTNAKGLVEIEIEKVGTSLKQEIEVDVENLPPSSSFRLVVDGKQVATFLTSSAGKRAMKFTRKDPA